MDKEFKGEIEDWITEDTLYLLPLNLISYYKEVLESKKKRHGLTIEIINNNKVSKNKMRTEDMITEELNDKHNRAMDMFEEALSLKKHGDDDSAKKLFTEAYELEKEVALTVMKTKISSLSKGIYLRSAGSMALNANLKTESIKMCRMGLTITNLDNEVREEILEILMMAEEL